MNTFLLRRLALRAAFLCAALFALAPAQAQNTMVRIHTTVGPIDISLLNAEAPVTVNNFLAYARAGDYTDVFFHRNAWTTTQSGTAPFVIQAGGYIWNAANSIVRVTSRGQIVNEYSPTRSNVRGTVAMAKIGGQPNSASSEWFINMGNNASNLNNQNGGFTVFGRVTTPGMAVADRISQLVTIPAASANFSFPELPVVNFTDYPVTRSNVVRFTSITEFPPNPSESARIFNFLEATFPQYLVPSIGVDGVALGYTYRYYSASNGYVGVKDGKVWYYLPAFSPDIIAFGNVADVLANAAAAGY